MSFEQRASLIDGSMEEYRANPITIQEAARPVIEEGKRMQELLERDKVVKKEKRVSLIDGSIEEIEIFAYKPFPFDVEASIQNILERKENG